MIHDRYDPVQLFDLVPQLQLHFEPELAELDPLLDDEVLFQQVKADLMRRCSKSTVTRRPSTLVDVILRRVIIKHLYAETKRVVGDSLVLRRSAVSPWCKGRFADVSPALLTRLWPFQAA